MNNYCTNCGNKLDQGDFFCKNCGTPVVDIPVNYVYKSPQKKKNRKKESKAILYILLLILLMIIGHNLKILSLKKKYIEKYINENYSNSNYKIKYNSSGKCIIDGNCSFDSGGNYCGEPSCVEYTYLKKYECKAYYFDVIIDGQDYILTLFRRNGVYSVVEGKNIYGNRG